jgi:hypothetical protein
MSETTGIIVAIVGIAISGAGMYVLTRSPRQMLGFLVVAAGLTIAGVGLLAIGDDWVQERTPATAEATPTTDATPAS